jgi:HAD superfamily hydrolase (TIGR01549 family)
LLILDLDETLIWSHINYKEMRKQILEFLETPTKSENYYNSPITVLLDLVRIKHPNKFNEAWSRIEKLEDEAIEKAEAIPFAEKLQELLTRNKINTAILTNNTRKGINRYITKFPFLESFFILTRDEVIELKPNPHGLLKIFNKFKQTYTDLQLKHTVFLGDSLIDAQAANTAGIRFIWFNSRNLDPSILTKVPFATITELSQLESIILETNFDCVF